MSYSLGFSPEFFLAEGEPYDRSDLALNKDGNPVSVYSALCKWQGDSPEEWADMARELFDCKPEFLSAETVLEKIQETDTCMNLSVPVHVYIDHEGNYSVDVWDER
jgi:hypothetical protein